MDHQIDTAEKALKIFFSRPRPSYTLRDVENLMGGDREARKIVGDAINAGELRPVTARRELRFSRRAVERWVERSTFWPAGFLAELLTSDPAIERVTLPAAILRGMLHAPKIATTTGPGRR